MSPKTLRFYDEIGLIKPAGVNPLNRYRYYSLEQLDQVRWIQELKGYGIPLAEISRMLSIGNQREIINMVERRLEELKWEKEQLGQTILNMERRLLLLNFEMSQMMKQFLQMTNDLAESVEEASRNLYQLDKFVSMDKIIEDPFFKTLMTDEAFAYRFITFAIVQFERGLENPQTEYLLALALSKIFKIDSVHLTTGKAWYLMFCQRQVTEEWVHRGIAYRVLGLSKESEILLRKSVECDHGNAENLIQLGMLLRDNSKYDEAEKVFLRAVDIRPDIADIGFFWCLLGFNYYLSGNYLNASKFLTKALNIEPTNWGVYHERGYSYLKLKQYMEAIEDFEVFHQHCQVHILSFYQKGIAYFNIQKYHKAVEAYNCAVTICQTSQFNYYFNGVWGQNHYNEAVKQYDLEMECFKEADQLKVDDAFSYYEWAKTCFKLGDQETSLSILREAIKLDLKIKDLACKNEMFRTFNDDLYLWS